MTGPVRTYNSGVKAVLLNRVLIVLGFLGVFIAGLLSLAHFEHLVPPCGASTGCDKVTNHPSSVWFGVPVAYLGLGAYLLLTGLALARAMGSPSLFKKTAGLSYAIAAGGTLISIGLQFYSFMVIQDYCKWCLASATTMTLTLIVTAFLYQEVSDKPVEQLATPRTAPDFMMSSGLALLLVLGLIGGNYSLQHSGISHVVDVSKIQLIPDDPNIYGDPKAPVTIVEFADLNCPSCQTNSPLIKEYVREHPGKIRLIYRHLPIPSHRTSQIAAAIDEYAAEKGRFWDYTMAVMATKKEVEDPSELFQIAASLNLDVNDIKKRLANDDDPIYKRLTADENAANAMGIAQTPTFILLVPGRKPSAYGPTELRDTLNGIDYQKLSGGTT